MEEINEEDITTNSNDCISNKRMVDEVCDNSLDESSITQKTAETTVSILPKRKNSKSPDQSTSSTRKYYNKLNEYSIGDIVWAMTDQDPVWPGIVVSDPETNIYYKSENDTSLLHIYYCNTTHKREWCNIKYIFKFEGKESFLMQFSNIREHITQRNSNQNWNLAVDQAECLITMDRDDRLDAYFSNSILPYTAMMKKVPFEKLSEHFNR